MTDHRQRHDCLSAALLHQDRELLGELPLADLSAWGLHPDSLANKDGVEIGNHLVMRQDGRFLLWRRK